MYLKESDGAITDLWNDFIEQIFTDLIDQIKQMKDQKH